MSAVIECEEHSSSEEEEAVVYNHDVDEYAHRLRGTAAAAFILVGALVLAVVGVTEIVAAENERRHGWIIGMCRITHDTSRNDSHCIYFGVTNSDMHPNATLCAVPASIAADASFVAPPACHGPDSADVAYWQSLSVGTEVECLVPASKQYTVPATLCMLSTASGHGVASIVWRTWIERFVYLTRTPREGAAAIEAISATRNTVGTVLLGIGATSFVAVIVVVYLCSSSQDGRMARHKIY